MKRGFGSPNYNAQRAKEVRQAGARAIHQQGKAHKWTREEAVDAGTKGGNARAANLSAHEDDELEAA